MYVRMEGTMHMSQASSRIDTLLSQVADTPKVATALLDALSKHIDGKTNSLRKSIHTFESKWDMNFEEFSTRVKTGKMARKISAHEVENDLKAWEQAVTMLHHYTSLRTR